MTHKIGRIRRRARRAGPAGGRGSATAVRRAIQAGNVQAKLKVGPQNDAYEREADRVAAHVMAGHSVESVSAMGSEQGQRKCDECEAEDAQRTPQIQRMEAETEDEEVLQTKQLQGDVHLKSEDEEEVQAKAHPDALQRQDEDEGEEIQAKAKPDGSFTAGSATSAQIAGLKGGGQPLPTSARAYFEPRFGADFSDVRVHTGAHARKAAQLLNARAFTTGRDVVFGAGEYAPNSHSGGALLAHELTHVIQQRGYKKTQKAETSTAALQRWKIGTAPVPGQPNWKLVPQGTPKGAKDHRKKLNDARAIIERVMKDKNCVKYFTDMCDAGRATSLKDAFDKTRLYFLDAGGTLFAENITGTGNIAYNRTTFNESKWFIASTLLHEIFHVCAPTITPNDDEWNAENAVEACQLYTPYLDSISPNSGAVGSQVTLTGWNFGPTQGKHDRVELNGLRCPVKSWVFNRSSSKVTIVVTLPAAAQSGMLRVINNNTKSRPAKFTVT